MQPSVILYGVAVIIVLRILHTIGSALVSPTRHIPGPFLARFTRLWYFSIVWSGKAEKYNQAVHRKYAKKGQFYAPIVRLGPNLYSIVKPDKQVYSISSKMRKSDWYEAFKHPSPDRWILFPDRDIQRHNETRKKFQGLYTLSSLVSYEGYVDNCADIFQKRLNEMAERGSLEDLGHWFTCYAFDVIGDITYSKRFGFLDSGKDHIGILKVLDATLMYSTLVGIYVWLHPYLFAILQMLPNSGAAGRQFLFKFTMENKSKEAQRKSRDLENEGKPAEEIAEDAPTDFLDKMLDMKRDNKKGVTDYDCYVMSQGNIIAGSDTTAASLSSIIYYLIKTPRALQKLRQEIRERTEAGACEEDRVSFKASQEMPYLQACIKEGLRLHPAVGLPLWRTVNEDGVHIEGEYLPPGSEVGINAWVTHYDRDIWGSDVNEFRPERWIEAENEDAEKLKDMEAHYLPFGLGSRTCLGKYISYLEMTKLVPQIVRNFDFELQHPDAELPYTNYWFVKPKNFRVRVKRHEKNV